MANPNPVTAPPVTVPGNLSGTLAGAVAALAVGWLAHAGYLAAAAAFLGQPEATMGLLATVIVGAGVNWAATQFAGIKRVQDIYAALPSTYAEYPADKNAPIGTTTTNLQTTSGNKVNGGV